MLWEGLLQLATEILIECGVHSLREPWRRRGEANLFLAGLGILISGAAAGVLTSFLLPMRIVRPGPIPGLSLLFSPLISGLVMERYGQWRETRREDRSVIATFWGGALFAFSMALVRFLWVGRS